MDIFLDYRKNKDSVWNRIGRAINPDNPYERQARASTAVLERNSHNGFWDKAMNALAKPAEWAARRIAGDDAVNNIKNAAEKGDIKGMVKGSVEGAQGIVKRLQGDAAGKGRRRRKRAPKRTIRRRR